MSEVKAVFTWSHKDIIRLGKKIGAKLDENEAVALLQQVEDEFDQEMGVSNKTFLSAIQEYLQSKGTVSNSKQQLANLDQTLSRKYKGSGKMPRIREFIGICQGIMFDETVYEVEVGKLKNWLLSNIDLRTDRVVAEVYSIYEEGRGKSDAELAGDLKNLFTSKYVKVPVKDSVVSSDDLDMGLGM